jgi:hypothetical protein
MAEVAASFVKVGNREYAIVPKDEYEELLGIPAGAEDTLAFSGAIIAHDLRAARAKAGLSQAELAKKVSQPMVANAELGKNRVGRRYMASVLKACGLPKDWKP